MKYSKLFCALLLSAFQFVSISAFADLTAIVTPGYTFSSTERADTSKLNRLGNPSIVITGTVGGTNAGIGAATINGTMMVDTFVDGTNITWNSASPRRLKIVDGGVGVTQISSNIAGLGLTGGSGTNLNVAIHTNNWLAIYDDMLSVKTNGLGIEAINGLTNVINILSTSNAIVQGSNTAWTSYSYALSAGIVASTNHPWSNAYPSTVRWVIECQTSEFNYSIGDDIPVESVRGTSEDIVFIPGWNKTNVFLMFKTTHPMQVVDRSDGTTLRSLTAGNWKAKCYARP